MRLSRMCLGNLNKKHWNRRVWEVGYKGPLLPQQKATGRPDYPVTDNMVAVTRERMTREFNVMMMLTKPYVDNAREKSWFDEKGISSLNELRENEYKKKEDGRMPGKPKGQKPSDKWKKANIGNVLHSHKTVEESLGYLGGRNRWD